MTSFTSSQKRSIWILIGLFFATLFCMVFDFPFFIYYLNICAFCVIVREIYVTTVPFKKPVETHWVLICLAALMSLVCSAMWFFYMVAVTKIQEHEYQYLFVSNLIPPMLIFAATSTFFIGLFTNKIRERRIANIDMMCIFLVLSAFSVGILDSFDYASIFKAAAPFAYFLIIIFSMANLFITISAIFVSDQLNMRISTLYLIAGNMLYCTICLVDAYENLTWIGSGEAVLSLPYERGAILAIGVVPFFIYMIGTFYSSTLNKRVNKDNPLLSNITSWIPLLILVPIAIHIDMNIIYLAFIILVLIAHALIGHHVKNDVASRIILEKELAAHDILKKSIETQSSQHSLANLKLRDILNKDHLTGLSNRSFLAHELTNMLKQENENVALYYINVQKFKLVNKTYGSEIGDRLLKGIAKSLLELVELEDMDALDELKNDYLVARFGSDEFAIVKKVSNKKEFRELADKILAKLSETFFIDHYKFNLIYNIGAHMLARHTQNQDPSELAQTLLKKADKALHFIKGDDKSQICFYSKKVKEYDNDRTNIEIMLRRADLSKDFEIFFQPIFDIRTRQICAAEALLRWNSPQAQLNAGEFINIAQNSDLGSKLCSFSANEVIKTIAKWRKEKIAVPKIGINILYQQFLSPFFTSSVKNFLQEHELDPKFIEVEFLEKIWQQPDNIINDALKGLNEMGVDICIDEFGIGNSSINNLEKYKVNRIKIARQISMTAMSCEKEKEQILASTIEIGKILGIKTTAKGISDSKLLSELARLGCDEVMGFALQTPMPTDDFKEYLIFNKTRLITP